MKKRIQKSGATSALKTEKLPKRLRAMCDRAIELGLALPASLTPSRLNGFQVDSFLQQLSDYAWDVGETMAKCAPEERGLDLERQFIEEGLRQLGFSFVVERCREELLNRDESAQLAVALAACRSIRFANDNAVRHGGDYSLNDLLAADKLAREALATQMTPEFIDRSARAILKKHRAQNARKKGGTS